MEIISYLYLSKTVIIELVAFHKHVILSIAGPITAIQDIWFVGDKFMNDVYHALPDIDTAAITNKVDRPYIFAYYNVKCYTANPLSRVLETPACIINSVIKAMNDRNRLPKTLIIIPDWDIVHYIDHHTYGFRLIAEKVLRWMYKSIDKAIESRKADLIKIRPGAVMPREPRIIWVEMIDRIHVYDRALAMQNKFSAALNEVLLEWDNHFLMNINMAMFDASLFQKTGELNQAGKKKFWSEIDVIFKKFDLGKLLLKPINYKNPNLSNNARHKLPMPPRNYHRYHHHDQPTFFAKQRHHNSYRNSTHRY